MYIDIPTLFSHNHTPPPFNRYNDAIHAVSIASLLSCSFFGMAVTGTALVMNVHSVAEFNYRMKNWFGGNLRERERAKNIDPEVLKIESAIEQFLADGVAAFDADKKKNEKREE